MSSREKEEVVEKGEALLLIKRPRIVNVGWEITGKCKTVILRGKVVVDDNKLLVKKGFGKFIKRNKVSLV